MTGNRYAAFADRPWDSSDWDPPASALAVPTMLSEEEGRLLYWLAADWAEGFASICDLGCFAGGSTARLAAGHQVARRAGAPGVHAYDLFHISKGPKEKFLYPNGVRWFWGSDLLPVARRLLKPWADRVTLHKADLAETAWGDGAIEILFIDAMKTPATADAILKNFVPSLAAGRSVIVHQDFQHWRQPWIAAQMELLGAYFEPIAWCAESTTVFSVVEAPDSKALDDAAVGMMTDGAMIAALRRMLPKAPTQTGRRNLARSILGLIDQPGCREPWKFDAGRITPDRVRAEIQQARSGTAG